MEREANEQGRFLSRYRKWSEHAPSRIRSSMLHVLPESARDTAVIAKVTSWLREHLGLEGVESNRGKLQVLLAGGITLDHLSEA